MASPKTLDLEDTISCNDTECRRPAVYSAEVCRLHLADVLRREGEDISFPQPEWDGVWAAVVHLVRVALQEVPKEALDGDGPRMDIDVYALIDSAIDRQFAHRVADMLATHLSDTFGAMSLQPPIGYEGDTFLMFRVPVPVRAAELIAPCLQAAMRGLMVEMFGAQSLRTAGARAQTPAPPVELSDEEESARLDAEQILSFAEKGLWARTQPPAVDDLPLERDLPNAKVVGESWASWIGCMVRTFSAPGQVVDSDAMATAFSDTCLVCGGDTRPDTTVTERTLTRGYYKCRLQHPSGELPAWWTDWKSSEVVDRQVIFTPDLVGGGNTWSTVELGERWGDEVSDLFWELRPTERPRPTVRDGGLMSSAGNLHALDHSPHALDHSVGGVLIVESHPSAREGLVSFLEARGLRVLGAAGDGAEAIRLVGELRPDVVTTEINLPILDGLSMTRAIREQFPGVRVIILTVYDDEVFRNEAKAAGAAAYVVKKGPESVEMLPTLIQNIGHR